MPKIMLVDDVDLFLQLERSYLEGCGYDLVTASSGEETLQRLERIVPDVLLLDYYMPGINGDDVCRAIRNNPRWEKLPILMVTAAGKANEIKSCIDAGCDDYITKPVNKNELQEKIERLLGQIKRRTSERVEVKIPVQVQHGDHLNVARAEDISTNGIYLKSPTELKENSVISLKLEGVEGDLVSLYGKVKRTDKGQNKKYGVYFIYPDQQSKDKLDQLVLKNKKDSIEKKCGADSDLSRRMQALEDECARLRHEQEDSQRRIGELEQENLDFANQLVQVEEVNNNLTNLYIASSRLHSTLDRIETLEIIKEVVINFVGAEKFAIFLLDSQQQSLVFETGEGFEDNEVFPEIALGEGVLGETAAKEENYFYPGSISDGSDDVLSPIIAIPLLIQGKLIGLLAIYRLFIQKEQLESIDYQLFSMLGEHAATALFSSTLYSHSERKRRTYQDVVDLLLK